MYAGARIVSFFLRFIAWLLLGTAVLVWFVVTISPPELPPGQVATPEAIKAANDARFLAYQIVAGFSLGCVLVALVIMLYGDLVKAIIDIAQNTHSMLQMINRHQQSQSATQMSLATPQDEDTQLSKDALQRKYGYVRGADMFEQLHPSVSTQH